MSTLIRNSRWSSIVLLKVEVEKFITNLTIGTLTVVSELRLPAVGVDWAICSQCSHTWHSCWAIDCAFRGVGVHKEFSRVEVTVGEMGGPGGGVTHGNCCCWSIAEDTVGEMEGPRGGVACGDCCHWYIQWWQCSSQFWVLGQIGRWKQMWISSWSVDGEGGVGNTGTWMAVSSEQITMNKWTEGKWNEGNTSCNTVAVIFVEVHALGIFALVEDVRGALSVTSGVLLHLYGLQQCCGYGNVILEIEKLLKKRNALKMKTYMISMNGKVGGQKREKENDEEDGQWKGWTASHTKKIMIDNGVISILGVEKGGSIFSLRHKKINNTLGKDVGMQSNVEQAATMKYYGCRCLTQSQGCPGLVLRPASIYARRCAQIHKVVWSLMTLGKLCKSHA